MLFLLKITLKKCDNLKANVMFHVFNVIFCIKLMKQMLIMKFHNHYINFMIVVIKMLLNYFHF